MSDLIILPALLEIWKPADGSLSPLITSKRAWEVPMKTLAVWIGAGVLWLVRA